ncbi:hypothetical protein ACJMK2_028032 [Sinanodonta woodiana]|uniref:Insulin-like domain-containing protein n=1 Tax=Sinanodonta woodiana TaxID=1069815 RepID=A0ABD3X5U9_SINWO
MAKEGRLLLQHFGATCLLLVPVLCGLERTCTPLIKQKGPHPQGACGSQLTNLVHTICEMFSGFKKRSYDADTTAVQGLGPPVFLPEQRFIDKKSALDFLAKRTAYEEKGIVCECCYHRCSLMELAQYCMPDGGFLIR